MLGNQVYGPYGNQRYLKGTMGTAKGYTGQYTDPTGLDYYNARYYDPVAGVFLSADRKQDNTQGMNPYAYVAGNPETFNDPTGQYLVGPGGQTAYPKVSPPPSVGSSAASIVRTPPVRHAPGTAPSGNPKTSRNPATHVGTSLTVPAADQRAKDVAVDLAALVAFERIWNGDDFKNDYAAAAWYLTDQNGSGNFFLGADDLGVQTIGVAHSIGRDEVLDPYHTSDAEQQLLYPWLKSGALIAMYALKLARLSGIRATLHVVLFTEHPPCDECTSFFTDYYTGSFAKSMKNLAEGILNEDPPLEPWPVGDIAVELDVFAKDKALSPYGNRDGWWRYPVPPSAITEDPDSHTLLQFQYR